LVEETIKNQEDLEIFMGFVWCCGDSMEIFMGFFMVMLFLFDLMMMFDVDVTGI